jgi:isoprenylcysteine carboxyl methyltransferase (ICMT) family protein YpbQ
MQSRQKATVVGLWENFLCKYSTVRLDWLVLILVFLATVDYRFRLFQGMPSFTVAEVGSYLAALLYIGVISIGGTPWTGYLRDLYSENWKVLRYFAWVLVACVVGVARSKDIVPVVKDLFPAFVLYVLIVSIVRTGDQIRRVIIAFLSGVGVNAMLGFSQVMTNRFYMGEMHEITLLKTDMYGNIVDHLSMGFMSHPNGFAMILLPAILLITAALRFDYFRSRSMNGLLLILLLLTGFDLYNTYSKGAIGWTSIGVMLLLVTPRIRSRWRFPIGVGALILGIGSSIAISIWLFLNYSMAFGTTLGRIELWNAGVMAVLSDPWIFLFGSGFAEMKEYTYLLYAYPLDNAHNGYLNQAIQYGVPAMIFFLMVVFSNMRNLARGGGKEDRDPIICFLFALHVAFFGVYFFELAQEGVSLQAMTFAMLALTTTILRVRKEARE